MEVRPHGSPATELLIGYSDVMLNAISELEELRAKRNRYPSRHYCGVMYSTGNPLEAPSLRAAMQGVYDYYASAAIEGVVPEWKSTESPHGWFYGVDIEWF